MWALFQFLSRAPRCALRAPPPPTAPTRHPRATASLSQSIAVVIVACLVALKEAFLAIAVQERVLLARGARGRRRSLFIQHHRCSRISRWHWARGVTAAEAAVSTAEQPCGPWHQLHDDAQLEHDCGAAGRDFGWTFWSSTAPPPCCRSRAPPTWCMYGSTALRLHRILVIRGHSS